MKKINTMSDLSDMIELTKLYEAMPKIKPLEMKDFVKLNIMELEEEIIDDEIIDDEIIDDEDERIKNINEYVRQFETSINQSCIRTKDDGSKNFNNINNEILIKNDNFLLNASNEISTIFNRDNIQEK